MEYGLLIGLILAIVAQSGTLWYKIGKLEGSIKEGSIKKVCPFGDCPFYVRAKAEVAPERKD